MFVVWNYKPFVGEEEEGFIDIHDHGPYCDCMVCVWERGYRTFRAHNKKKTIIGWTDVRKEGQTAHKNQILLAGL